MKNVIIVDTSGSMSELGKASVIRNLLYTIEQFFRTNIKNYDYEIVLWNDELKEYRADASIAFQGKNDLTAIEELLIAENQLIFLTDGNVADKCSNRFANALSKSKLAVLIGADNNKAKMQKAFGIDNVYAPTDIETCLCKLHL